MILRRGGDVESLTLFRIHLFQDDKDQQDTWTFPYLFKE